MASRSVCRAAAWPLLAALCLVCCSVSQAAEEARVGVNWGTLSSQKLDPSIIVEMLQANGIRKVKLFDAEPTIVEAFRGSQVELMVAVPNDQLQLVAQFPAAARKWVRENVTRFIRNNVKIKYVAVGNEPFLRGYNGSYLSFTYPALNNIQQALIGAGFGAKVKATVPMNADVLTDGVVAPSRGTFRADVAGVMAQIVTALAEHDSPFTVNIYPFLSLQQDPDYPRDFAFFGGTKFPVVDGAHEYTNDLDASLDTLVSALTKLGFPGMEIVVGEIGWPTDGDPNANAGDARMFNQQLVEHVSTGTPLYRRPIDVYIFSLIDEDRKSVAPGGFERHWGIYWFDGTAKYPELNLFGKPFSNVSSPASLSLVSSKLVDAKGVNHLTKRWCVLDLDGDLTAVARNMDYACTYADCTSLQFGGSCNDIGGEGNASYAFNSYYQLNSQDHRSCYFDGLGVLTTEDPSLGDCAFKVGIVQSSVSRRSHIFLIFKAVLFNLIF